MIHGSDCDGIGPVSTRCAGRLGCPIVCATVLGMPDSASRCTRSMVIGMKMDGWSKARWARGQRFVEGHGAGALAAGLPCHLRGAMDHRALLRLFARPIVGIYCDTNTCGRDGAWDCMQNTQSPVEKATSRNGCHLHRPDSLLVWDNAPIMRFPVTGYTVLSDNSLSNVG